MDLAEAVAMLETAALPTFDAIRSEAVGGNDDGNPAKLGVLQQVRC